MKTIIRICLPIMLLWNSACTEDILESKPGVSLPPVTDLVMEEMGENNVKLTWNIPESLPGEISQPVSVFIQVTQITGPTTSLPEFSATLPDAPEEFVYQIPDTAKTYHLTVKLRGNTKTVDKNYSNEIYSQGQTVVYAP